MSQDPYGYSDSAAPTQAGDSTATWALWSGVVAAMCAALGPCTCYMSYFMAVPAGFAGLYYGWLGSTSGSTGLARSASTAGLMAGLIALIPSLLILIGLGLYAVVIVVAIAIGAAENL